MGKKDGRLITGGEPRQTPAKDISSSQLSSLTSSPKSQLEQEEIFGPVLAVIKVKELRSRPGNRQ